MVCILGVYCSYIRGYCTAMNKKLNTTLTPSSNDFLYSEYCDLLKAEIKNDLDVMPNNSSSFMLEVDADGRSVAEMLSLL